MDAIPPYLPAAPDETISGLSCPECFGVLRVSALGSRPMLRFRCRIGHLYSAEEVIIGKERRLEEHLWAAVTAVTELAALLEKLTKDAEEPTPKNYTERAARATCQAEAVRKVIAENEPTAVEPGPGPQTGEE